MPAFIAAAAAVGGSLIGADSARSAANKAADAQRYAADQAAEAAKFKPYSLTTGFGRGFFDTEKNTAGYEIDPRLAAFRDQLYGQAEQTLGQLQGTTPEQQAQQYVNQQMGLLAPTREAEDLALRQKMLGGGRIGLGVSSGFMGGDTQGLINPDQYGVNLARERANAEIGAAGTAYGQNIYDKLIARGTGLFTSGAGIEQLGMSPLTTGADIGNKAAVAGANQGSALLQGGMAAANSNLAAGLNQANAYQQAGKTIGGMDFKNTSNPFSGMFTVAQQPLRNEVSSLGSNTYNPYSDYNTGANGWGNYGE